MYTPPSNAIVLIIARLFISAIFLMSGFGKIFDFSGTAGYMEAHGIPIASLFLLGAIIFELLGGFSILLGYKANWGAVLLIIFLIPTTLIFHGFWRVEEEAQRMETIQFMKNLAILGGLFFVYSFGSGSLSLDRYAGKKQQRPF